MCVKILINNLKTDFVELPNSHRVLVSYLTLKLLSGRSFVGLAWSTKIMIDVLIYDGNNLPLPDLNMHFSF